MPNVLSPRDLVFRPDNMDETVPHISVFETTALLNFSNIQYFPLATLPDL